MKTSPLTPTEMRNTKKCTTKNFMTTIRQSRQSRQTPSKIQITKTDSNKQTKNPETLNRMTESRKLNRN